MLATCLNGAGPALAQGPTGDGPPGDATGNPSTTSVALGLGGISRQKPYAGIRRDNKVLPVLRFENRHVQVFGPMVGLKLPGLTLSPSQRLDASLVLRYDGSGYEAKDAPILQGMRKRRSGVWAGAKAEWKAGFADVGIEWLADVSGHSKGQVIGLGVERTWFLAGRLMLTPRIVATWQDRRTVDYYFGVRDDEARAGRPAYAGRAGVRTDLGLRALYLVDARQSLFMDLELSSLSTGTRDSPLVDRSTENRVVLGFLYRLR